ncbi:MAG: Uma2 family endonuclease [Cytophagales bacterium]|nr:Uma2 family endonuclease [Cytophagales bacterium]
MRKNFEIESPPRTIMQVYQSLPEGTLAELIDNIIFMSPSPIYRHQKVILTLAVQLQKNLEEKGLGIIAFAPFDVYLDETSNAVQPDLVVVLKDNLAILNEEGHIHGVPDLLIEILSPGNTQHDTVRKKNLYEKFGVKEYWIVDPDSKRASVFQLQNQTYQLHYEGLGQIESPLLNLTLQF